MKICCKCHIEKDESEFTKDKSRKDGLFVRCKSCNKKYTIDNIEHIKIKSAINRKKNKEYQKEYNKKYREENKEKLKEKQKEYRENNKDKIFLNRKKYREKNKEIISNKKREYYKNNKERLKLKFKNYQKNNKINRNIRELNRKKNDKDYKIKSNIRTLFISNFKSNSIKKKSTLFYYTGFNIQDYIEYLKTNYSEDFKNITDKNKIHIDHIIPVSAYDFTIADDIKKCWNPNNLRLISSAENIFKKNKLDYDLIKQHNIEHLLPKKIKDIK